MTIPQFEPLPPTSLLNRIINKVLAPLYYLLFTIITSIVVVPIYTIIENFKRGRNSKGGERFASNQNPNVQARKPSQAKDFLASYSSSYVAPDGDVKPKSGHHHQHHTRAEKERQGF